MIPLGMKLLVLWSCWVRTQRGLLKKKDWPKVICWGSFHMTSQLLSLKLEATCSVSVCLSLINIPFLHCHPFMSFLPLRLVFKTLGAVVVHKMQILASFRVGVVGSCHHHLFY